jgi:hypothetical protein
MPIVLAAVTGLARAARASSPAWSQDRIPRGAVNLRGDRGDTDRPEAQVAFRKAARIISALSHQSVDALILSFAKTQWRKVAMVISQVLGACRARGVSIDADGVAGCVCILAESGQLEAQGDRISALFMTRLLKCCMHKVDLHRLNLRRRAN